MKQYERLSFEEREEISRLLSRGASQSVIAKALGRDRSTISREVKAGSCNRYTYRAGRADRRAKRQATGRRQGKHKLFQHARLWRDVIARLRLRWSPDQIAKRLRIEYPHDTTMRISPEAIYHTIYVLPKGTLKKELVSYLRRGHRRRRQRKTGDQPIAEREIKDMVMIDERPFEAENRLFPGHWEGDLLIGKNRQSALGSLTERTTRYAMLVPLTTKRASEVSRAFARALQKVPRRLRLSLTYDQGREMAEHKRLTRKTKVRVYFAHKASPWERGTNENTNGLIRQFFPKGTDFSKVSGQEINRAERLLNGRPRKVLGYRTPDESFKDLLR